MDKKGFLENEVRKVKKSVKKVFSLFLCVTLCLTMFPAAAFAEDGTAEGANVPAEQPESGTSTEQMSARTSAAAVMRLFIWRASLNVRCTGRRLRRAGFCL